MRPPPRALLDIGCGNGMFTGVLAGSLPGARITATDPLEQRGFPSLRNAAFVRGSVERLPFEEGSFDAAVTALSLHHWGDKAKGIREAGRVLKKGGRLVIGDPLLEGWLGNPFWGWLAQAVDRGSFTDGERLTGYLEQAGFRFVAIRLIPDSMKALYLITAVKA